VIVGVDFGASRWVRAQRRKIVALAAHRTSERSYRIDGTGLNARLLGDGAPGYGAAELADRLLAQPARVVGCDFPFGIPEALLVDEHFAASAGYRDGAFGQWRSFHRFVATALPLVDPLDFSPFSAWREPSRRDRLWARRVTDVVAGAQPPLKDRFQATFQMTLLGNAVLARLSASGRYRVSPFADDDAADAGAGELIEVYPGATLRRLGLARYKDRPAEALQRARNACAAAGIILDVDERILAVCRTYDSGGAAPDHDAADAFVALCTAILYAHGACRPALPASEEARAAREGIIWLPAAAPR